MPPPSGKVKKAYSCTSTPPCRAQLRGRHGGKLTMAPTLKKHYYITGQIGNMGLINSGFHTQRISPKSIHNLGKCFEDEDI
jgi:hypothetical protein